MKPHRWLVVASCSGLLVSGALACGSFSSSETSGTDGGTDAPVGLDVSVPVDGTVADGGAPGDGGLALFEIANGLDDVEAIAVTDSAVFVVEHDAGQVLSFPIGGGTRVTIDPTAGSPLGVAVSGDYVYWSNHGGASVRRAPLAGGMITSVSTAALNPFAMAPTPSGIVVLLLDGSLGSAQQYTPDLIAGPAPATGLANPVDIATFGTDIYWTESSAGRIGHGTAGVETDAELVTGQSDCQSIAADATGVYWVNRAGGEIRTTSLTGGTVTTLAAGEQSPHSIVADGTSVAWLTRDGKLRQRKHGQTLPTTRSSGFLSNYDFQLRARVLAVNSSYFVWVTTDGRILRLAK